MKRETVVFAALLLTLLAPPAAPRAQYMPPPPGRPFPVHPRVIPFPPAWGTITPERMELDAQIRERVARVSVTQEFRNPTSGTLEGDFLFPLPPGVAVTDLVFEVDGRELAGELMEADQARRHYESVVRRRRDPALLEYAGHNLFRARVFPIPPQATRRLTLSYSQILPTDVGLAEFRFPLGGGRLVPPGEDPLLPSPWGIERSGGQDRGLRGGMEVLLDITLEEELEIGSIYSPSHVIEVAREGSRRARVSLGHDPAEAAADFLLYYALDPGELGLSLFTHVSPGEDGYFLILASPGGEGQREERAPLTVLFVLDTSGSMGGGKLDEARRALDLTLSNLTPEDRFGLVAFSSTVDPFQRELVGGTPANVRAASSYLKRLRPSGGTNLAGALTESFRILAGSGARGATQVFLLTDGLPTVGETNVGEILVLLEGLVEQGEASGDEPPHVFSVGVGYDVNTHLLSHLAQRFLGAVEYVTPGESVEVKVGRLLEKTSRPLLTDLEFSLRGWRAGEVYPPRLPFLFRGEQVSVVGRFSPGDARRVRVAVTADRPDGGTLRLGREFGLGPAAPGGDFVARLWASRKVAFLLDEIRLRGERDELVEELVAVAKRFGIVTEYTSYLADPQFLAAGAWGSGGMEKKAREALPVLREQSGEGAVRAGISLSAMKRSITPSFGTAAPPAAIRWVGGRTFYLLDGIWTDEAWSEELPTLSLRPYGTGYLRLLREWPEGAPFLSLGETVRVVVGGMGVEISPQAADDLDSGRWSDLLRGLAGS